MLEHSDFTFCFDSSKCKECGGKCCTGEQGYIFVNSKEIEAIAEFLNFSFEEFCQKFVKKVGYRYSLLDILQSNGAYSCVFFKNGICQIYPKRPKQCVTFPFWDIYRNDFDAIQKECIGVVKK